MSQQPTTKITILDGVSLQSPIVTDNTIKVGSNGATSLTLPSSAGTLALTSDLTGMVTVDGTQTLTNKTLTAPKISSISNGAATVTVPSTTGTLALSADVTTVSNDLSTLDGKFGRLVTYLKNWINVGNLTMSDIESAVNGSS